MKKVLFVSLLTAFTVSAQAATPAQIAIDNKATNHLVEKQIDKISKVDARVLAKINKAVADATDTKKLIKPESVTEIITAAILARPEQAFAIVQSAVAESPELVNEIIQAAVDAGADEGEMIAAALSTGLVTDADIELATAANITAAPTISPAPAGLGGGTGGGGATASQN